MSKKEFFSPIPSENPGIKAFEPVIVRTLKSFFKSDRTGNDKKKQIEELLSSDASNHKIGFEDSVINCNGSLFIILNIHGHKRKQSFVNLNFYEKINIDWTQVTANKALQSYKKYRLYVEEQQFIIKMIKLMN